MLGSTWAQRRQKYRSPSTLAYHGRHSWPQTSLYPDSFQRFLAPSGEVAEGQQQVAATQANRPSAAPKSGTRTISSPSAVFLSFGRHRWWFGV
jgi:hypothetical protein